MRGVRVVTMLADGTGSVQILLYFGYLPYSIEKLPGILLVSKPTRVSLLVSNYLPYPFGLTL